MYYYGDESEIDLDAHGEREFSDWRWMPLEQLPEEVCLLLFFFLPLTSAAKHRACRAVPGILTLLPHMLHACLAAICCGESAALA